MSGASPGGFQTVWGEAQWMKLKKKIKPVIALVIKRITKNSRNVCDLVKEIAQRNNSLGNFTVSFIFPELNASRQNFFMYLVWSEVNQTVISGYCGSIVKWLWLNRLPGILQALSEGRFTAFCPSSLQIFDTVLCVVWVHWCWLLVSCITMHI